MPALSMPLGSDALLGAGDLELDEHPVPSATTRERKVTGSLTFTLPSRNVEYKADGRGTSTVAGPACSVATSATQRPRFSFTPSIARRGSTKAMGCPKV